MKTRPHETNKAKTTSDHKYLLFFFYCCITKTEGNSLFKLVFKNQKIVPTSVFHVANGKIIRIGEVGCLSVSTIFFGVRESLLGAGLAPTRFASAPNLSVEACQPARAHHLPLEGLL